jgi:ketosteroid isomerase-like protein
MKTQTKEETVISELLAENAAAISRRDLDAHMKDYAPDLLMFDAIPPLAYRGAEKLRAAWQICLDHTDGTLELRHHELDVTVSGDLALATSLVSFKAHSKGRDLAIESMMRSTFALQKRDGVWKIVHGHGSVPFDPMSEKALTQEKPVIS